MNLIIDIKKRIARIHADMKENRLKALLISLPENVTYLTGKDTGKILLTPEIGFLWTKGLYQEIYRDLYSSKGYPFHLEVYEKDVIKKKIRELRIKRLCVENLDLLSYNRLKKELRLNLKVTDIVENQRAVKSRYEIELLKKSVKIANKGMKKAIKVIKDGVREIDAVTEIEHEIRKQGSESPSFKEGMILASGKNSADIHAKATRRKIQTGDLVVVDLGARYSGYYSDMTRTFSVGRSSTEEWKILELVKEIQNKAIDRLEVGMKAKEIHNFVETEIERGGYKFYHAAGHGIGLDVHELPNINSRSKDILKEGMVFTIEPGIYIPGKFGIRFEDMILLRKNKVEILTR